KAAGVGTGRPGGIGVKGVPQVVRPMRRDVAVGIAELDIFPAADLLEDEVDGARREPDFEAGAAAFARDPRFRKIAVVAVFEGALVHNRVVLAKFYLTISKDEQLTRFQAREQTSFKRFKITADDWRNREQWDAYETAVCDMVDRTSTEIAPWTLIEANDKF